MCSSLRSKNTYLYQEAVPVMPAHTGITAHTTPSTESLRFYNVCHYVGSDFGHVRAKPDRRFGGGVLLTHEGKKRTKPITHIQIFHSVFFCPATQTSEEHTTLCCPSSPIPSGMFLPIVAFTLDCTMWLSSHHFDRLGNSLLILILYLKLEESLCGPSLFLD